MNTIFKFKILLLSIVFFISTVSAAEVTFIPTSKIVTQGETFDLNVSIDPMGAAIAGAQLNIEFNNSMLHVNDILEGNLFKKNGISTSFYGGIIDNSQGMVINIYSAILGPFNVSSPETFIIINVTATGSEGEAWINLSNVRICDPEGGYTILNVTNGRINIKRIASELTPPAGVENLKYVSYARDYINWTWTDPGDQDFAKVMVYLNDIYQNDVLKGVQYYNASVAPGTYTIGITTVDIDGNVNPIVVTNNASTILPPVRFINGTVQDSVTKAVLAGVTITTSTGISTTTDESGFYSLAVTEDTYDIIGTSEPKYYPVSMINVMTSLSAATIQDIELVKKPTGTITGSVKKI